MTLLTECEITLILRNNGTKFVSMNVFIVSHLSTMNNSHLNNWFQKDFYSSDFWQFSVNDSEISDFCLLTIKLRESRLERVCTSCIDTSRTRVKCLPMCPWCSSSIWIILLKMKVPILMDLFRKWQKKYPRSLCMTNKKPRENQGIMKN